MPNLPPLHTLELQAIHSPPLPLLPSPNLRIKSPVPRKIARLRREIAPLRQTPNPAQQKLQLPIRRPRRILRNLMSRVLHSHKRQASLCVHGAIDAGASSIAVCIYLQAGDVALVQHFLDDLADGFVVGDEEVVGCWAVLEALVPVPGHVLDCD